MGPKEQYQLNIHLCWMLMWAGTLKHQSEGKERVLLAMQAIEEIKQMVYKRELTLPLEMFKVVISAAHDFGDERMLRKFEACIDELKLPANLTIETLLMNATQPRVKVEKDNQNKVRVTQSTHMQFLDRQSMI